MTFNQLTINNELKKIRTLKNITRTDEYQTLYRWLLNSVSKW
ncbi:hypothetical protein [Photorhabdus temperata]|uniref:Uncharacterized protein n=1 Tax=Photorhabdus temperata J3 TaxID=1389415 RepID=U7QWU5_PHOTE|nr:hypothetical protein [Photorhabdus temperata]ERT11817.1 hypothetical protein O185_17505 [Photorhabdus temperata J3]